MGRSQRQLCKISEKINVLTTYVAFNQLQLREEYGLLRGPRAAWFTLLAREKERGGRDNAVTRMILRLRDAVGKVLIKIHEVEERYVAAFVDATICYMGGRETYIHLLEEDIPDEATFFGARLGGVDMLMVAAVQLRDMDLIRLLATTGKVGVRPGSKVYAVAQYLACLKGDLGMLQLVRGLGNPHPNAPSGYLERKRRNCQRDDQLRRGCEYAWGKPWSTAVVRSYSSWPRGHDKAVARCRRVCDCWG